MQNKCIRFFIKLDKRDHISSTEFDLADRIKGTLVAK